MLYRTAMADLISNPGDKWGRWGQAIVTGSRWVPTTRPHPFQLGTENGDASTPMNTALSPCPQSSPEKMMEAATVSQ